MGAPAWWATPAAWLVDSLSGAGLVDQQNSFLGKLLLHVVVFAVLLFRTTDVLPKYKGLLDEVGRRSEIKPTGQLSWFVTSMVESSSRVFYSTAS